MIQTEVDQAAEQLEDYDLVADIDAATKALLNPLILHEVLRSLDAPTLKSARLVCTDWAEVGATFLGKKSLLTFGRSPNRTNYTDLASFNHKLAKNIELLCNDICTCSPISLTNLTPNFVRNLPRISDKLETFKLFGVTALQPVQEIWSAYHFPNLTQIWIIADGNELDKRASSSLDMAEFRPLPNLTRFSLEISPKFGRPSSNAAMSTITQTLVNSAPNLNEIDLDVTFFLDLTECGKLKKLGFKYFPWGISCKFDVSGMTKMLESCRNSLESLTLDYCNWSDTPNELNFHLPNLTHLKLECFAVYIMKDSLSFTNLPKLTYLSMSDFDTCSDWDISGLLRHFHLRHVGITSLDLSCTHSPEIATRDGAGARKLVNLFPAVKEFRVKLGIEFISDEDDARSFSPLRETMRSFGEWELTCGQVNIEIKPNDDGKHDPEFGPELVIAVLRGMRGWRGLANTSLQFTAQRDAEFLLSDELRAALLSCRTIRSVTITGFLMDAETKENFQTFIRDHNLAISFTD